MREYIITIEDWFFRYAHERYTHFFGCPIEEVVRCRDCVHMHTVRSWLGMDVDECWLHADPESGALGKEPTEPDGYCAWAEKRTDE